MKIRSLGDSQLRVTSLGLGLAAVARPGYINLGRDRDLPAERSQDALYRRCADLLDVARELGICYFDVARSYGRSEEFLARWLSERNIARDELTVGSKWGYRYTADWAVEAEVHEQKELSLARFREQLTESRGHLESHLDLYQIHSATLDSGVLDDDRLMAALVAARHDGAFKALGLTLSGPASPTTLDRALALQVDGVRVFDCVQATYNILEPSIAAGLADAQASGVGVIVKEVHANGRLTQVNRRPEDRDLVARLDAIAATAGLTVDQLAVAFVASLPFIDVVNSGAATVDHLRSHAVGIGTHLSEEARASLEDVLENPQQYWATRSSLPWN